MQRLTRATIRTVAAFLESPSTWRYGYDLMRDAQLASGTLYPILARLLADGWMESRWEDSEHRGKPARQMYRLTATGRVKARDAIKIARPEWLMPAGTPVASR